jgi:bifunctional non-homologous end joining protein LigD
MPAGADWTFERKYDGYRLQLVVDQQGARAFSRSGVDWTDRLAHWIEGMAVHLPKGMILDGELCIRHDDGRTSFAEMARAIRDKGALRFHAFDVLVFNFADLRQRPLSERRQVLERQVDGVTTMVEVVRCFGGPAPELLDLMRRQGHEGVIAKRLDAPYRSGERNGDWLKFKCTQAEEFLAVGCQLLDDGAGVSSLVLATPHDGQLSYRGRVGTGFTQDERRELARRPLVNGLIASPFIGAPRLPSAIWFRDPLVVQVAFAGTSASGRILHPAFLGVREDKTLADLLAAA